MVVIDGWLPVRFIFCSCQVKMMIFLIIKIGHFQNMRVKGKNSINKILGNKKLENPWMSPIFLLCIFHIWKKLKSREVYEIAHPVSKGVGLKLRMPGSWWSVLSIIPCLAPSLANLALWDSPCLLAIICWSLHRWGWDQQKALFSVFGSQSPRLWAGKILVSPPPFIQEPLKPCHWRWKHQRTCFICSFIR